jgi:hypothetical protein
MVELSCQESAEELCINLASCHYNSLAENISMQGRDADDRGGQEV